MLEKPSPSAKGVPKGLPLEAATQSEQGLFLEVKETFNQGDP